MIVSNHERIEFVFERRRGQHIPIAAELSFPSILGDPEGGANQQPGSNATPDPRLHGKCATCL